MPQRDPNGAAALDWRIKTPAFIQLVGPSQAGKSTLIRRLIADDAVWDRPIRAVFYCAPDSLSDDQRKALEEAAGEKELTVRDGDRRLPELTELLAAAASGDLLFVADDLLGFDGNLGLMRSLATAHSHHRRISCLYSVQNPYAKRPGLDFPTMSRNATGHFVLYQISDWLYYDTLSRRLFPDRSGYLLRRLLESQEKYGCSYVFVHTHPRGGLPRKYACRTALLENERRHGSPIVFDLDDETPPKSSVAS